MKIDVRQKYIFILFCLCCGLHKSAGSLDQSTIIEIDCGDAKLSQQTLNELPRVVIAVETKRTIEKHRVEGHCRAYGGCDYEDRWYLFIEYLLFLDDLTLFTLEYEAGFDDHKSAIKHSEDFKIQPGDRIAYSKKTCRRDRPCTVPVIYRDGKQWGPSLVKELGRQYHVYKPFLCGSSIQKTPHFN